VESGNKFSGGAFADLKRSLSDKSVVVVPIPALSIFLLEMERRKGDPLTENEVLAARDAAPAITMNIGDRDQFFESRGSRDIDPDNVWPEWREFRAAVERDD